MKNEVSVAIHVEKKQGSLVVITGELPFSELEKHRSHAVKTLAQEVTIDGFRKGHIPESILIKTLGEMTLITEMAERALGEHYPKFIETEKLDVIGYPKISITKIAKDNPLGFSIEVAIVPEVTLPDYKKIAHDINAEKETKEVTDAEVTKQVEEILRQKVAYERLQKKAQHEPVKESHVHGEDCDHEHDLPEPIEDIKNLPLPELTDAYVKTLGKPGQFENVEDFKSKIKEHLTIEKAHDVDSRHRAKITDTIVDETVAEIPQVLIDAEINQMFAQMEEDLKRAQLKMEDYLGHLKKTRDDLKKEWTPSAEKRAKLQLTLNAIAKKEQVVPDVGRVDQEISQLLAHYKDADEKRVRVYVESVLTNDAVMQMLEKA